MVSSDNKSFLMTSNLYCILSFFFFLRKCWLFLGFKSSLITSNLFILYYHFFFSMRNTKDHWAGHFKSPTQNLLSFIYWDIIWLLFGNNYQQLVAKSVHYFRCFYWSSYLYDSYFILDPSEFKPLTFLNFSKLSIMDTVENFFIATK